jgi:hypothetical protein
MITLILKLIIPFCTFVDVLKFQQLRNKYNIIFSSEIYWGKLLYDNFEIYSIASKEKFKSLYMNSYPITKKKKMLLNDYFEIKECSRNQYRVIKEVEFDIDNVLRLFKFSTSGPRLDLKIFDLCYLGKDYRIRYRTLTVYSDCIRLQGGDVLDINITIKESSFRNLERYYCLNVLLDLHYDHLNIKEFKFSIMRMSFNFFELKNESQVKEIKKKLNKLNHHDNYKKYSLIRHHCIKDDYKRHSREIIIFRLKDYYMLYYDGKYLNHHLSIEDMISSVNKLSMAKSLLDCIIANQ